MTSQERKNARYRRRQEERLKKKNRKFCGCDDFEKIFTYENLYNAAKECKKGVRWKASVQKFLDNKILILARLKSASFNGTFKIKNTYQFTLRERGKERRIRSIGIEERVVQRCLCDNALVPVLTNTFIYDNGASLKDKGVSFAHKRMKKHVEGFMKTHKDGYVLVFDFKKYFESIPHENILRIMQKHFTDQRIIDLVMYFTSYINKGKGLDLGSQISQVLALAAANDLDHYIKEVLGAKYYARYMDDGYILCEDKKQLTEFAEKIDEYTQCLGLTLNKKKTRVIKLTKGFVFLKRRYRIIDGKLLITSTGDSHKRMRRKLKKFVNKLAEGHMTYDDVAQSVKSYIAHLKGTKCYTSVKVSQDLFDKLFVDSFKHNYSRCVPNNNKEGVVLCFIK